MNRSRKKPQIRFVSLNYRISDIRDPLLCLILGYTYFQVPRTKPEKSSVKKMVKKTVPVILELELGVGTGTGAGIASVNRIRPSMP